MKEAFLPIFGQVYMCFGNEYFGAAQLMLCQINFTWACDRSVMA